MRAVIILASFAAGVMATWAVNWLALIPWRRTVGQHWAERTRVLYPALMAARLNRWLVPLNLALAGVLVAPLDLFWYFLVPGWVGAALGTYFLVREILPDYRFGVWLHRTLAGWLVFVLIAGTTGGCVYFMPPTLNWLSLLVGGVFLVLVLAWFNGGVLRLWHWLRLVQPAGAPLQALVAEVSTKMGVPVRSVWESPNPIANAWAFPATKDLLFTHKLLATLSAEETQAICAHELGHLNEPRGKLWRVWLPCLNALPIVFINPVEAAYGGNGVIAIVVLIILLLLLRRRFGQKMEKRSDDLGAKNSADAATYARALAKIYEVNQTPAVLPRRSLDVHPSLYDRMVAVGITPDFPRPLPPVRRAWTSWFMRVVFVMLVLALGFMAARNELINFADFAQGVFTVQIKK